MTEQPAEFSVLVILPPVEAAEVAVDDALEEMRGETDDSSPYGSRAAWEIGEIRRFDQPFAVAVLPKATLIRDGQSGLSWESSKGGWHVNSMIAAQGAGIAAWVRVTPHSDHPRPVVTKNPSRAKLIAQAAAIGIEAYGRGARRADRAFWNLVDEIEAERGDPWGTFEREARETWGSDHDVDCWLGEYSCTYVKEICGAFRCLCLGVPASEANIFSLGYLMITTSEGEVIGRDNPKFDELMRPYLDKKQ